ncbi:hypothetical protein [Methanobrevibacter sp.]|uniref:hypothetical protein n=1 Tax=Methanobrevibacter sp. TaxID=66852 RepID=UPI0026DF300B|nr:hypothetical protein [Methanobrevibacter sp.]MDO5859408.1 hypothetical protein [Methanobrevibacter sp.]
MKKSETIFFTILIIILLIYLSFQPEHYPIFLFLLGLALIVMLIAFLTRYKKRFENQRLSLTLYVIGIILFTACLANSVLVDFANCSPLADNYLIITVFIIIMIMGWFFEKKQ